MLRSQLLYSLILLDREMSLLSRTILAGHTRVCVCNDVCVCTRICVGTCLQVQAHEGQRSTLGVSPQALSLFGCVYRDPV